MTDRWQDDPERAGRIAALLADVERRRAGLEAAEAAEREPDVPRHEATERAARARGALAGLRAAVAMAFFDPAAPPDEDIAASAGWTVEQVDRHRDKLNASTRI